MVHEQFPENIRECLYGPYGPYRPHLIGRHRDKSMIDFYWFGPCWIFRTSSWEHAPQEILLQSLWSNRNRAPSNTLFESLDDVNCRNNWLAWQGWRDFGVIFTWFSYDSCEKWGAEAEVARLSRQLSELTFQLRTCLDGSLGQLSRWAAEKWRCIVLGMDLTRVTRPLLTFVDRWLV